MLGYIFTGLIAFILGIVVWYLRDRHFIIAQQEKDQSTWEENQRIAYENKHLSEERQYLSEENEHLTRYNNELKENIKILEIDENQLIGKIKGLSENLSQAEENAKDAAERFYTQSLQIAQEKFEQSLSQESDLYKKAIEAFHEEMSKIKSESAIEFSKELQQRQYDLEVATNVLKDMQAKVAAAVEASKRTEEMETQQNFYRIQLSEIDIEEIEKLRAVEPYLRNKEALNKVIWKVFYEKPTTDLIGRVVSCTGANTTGIYKITNIKNQKCYIGQAVNIGERWKQHIKKGLGADPPTRNKLYPAMKEIGPENFTFEVIEKCDRSLLDSREDYWQEYFKAKEFGYSIK